MSKRTITIGLCDEFKSSEQPSGLQKAIGYACLWAAGSDHHLNVRLWIDKDYCIDATYTNDKGDVTFVMGGICDRIDKTYSFHS